MTTCYANFSDVDLLGMLIGTRESRKLYRGSLQPLFSASPEEGKPQEKCTVARELVKRWLNEELKRECLLSAPSSVRDYLRVCFANQEHESFLVLYLDAQNRLILGEELFRGTLTQTSVYPREVVKGALRNNAAAVIFSHNHPSGVAEPSRADESLTQALKAALALVVCAGLAHAVSSEAETM
jgi:DNA repair protein RadC